MRTPPRADKNFAGWRDVRFGGSRLKRLKLPVQAKCPDRKLRSWAVPALLVRSGLAKEQPVREPWHTDRKPLMQSRIVQCRFRWTEQVAPCCRKRADDTAALQLSAERNRSLHIAYGSAAQE